MSDPCNYSHHRTHKRVEKGYTINKGHKGFQIDVGCHEHKKG